jgi:hypothetical protein
VAEHAGRLQRAAEQGFEPKDISIRGVLVVAAILAATIALSAAALGGLVWLFESMANRPAVSPLERSEVVPPEPRLNPRPAQQLVAIHRREDGVLQSYGWVDRETGIAHIPIDKAMAILAERGWPKEAEEAAGPAPAEARR